MKEGGQFPPASTVANASCTTPSTLSENLVISLNCLVKRVWLYAIALFVTIGPICPMTRYNNVILRRLSPLFHALFDMANGSEKAAAQEQVKLKNNEII